MGLCVQSATGTLVGMPVANVQRIGRSAAAAGVCTSIIIRLLL